MDDSTIIWKFLIREFPDTHQAIYLYCAGGSRSIDTAIYRIMPITLKIFAPPISKDFIEKTVKSFLEYKKKQFGRGEIKIRPLYGP
jgi:hypothetical protein